VLLMLLAVLGPQLVFLPRLRAAMIAGKDDYGALAQRYVREFDRKWIRGGAAPGELLVGSADIQSLADLHNSFSAVEKMRLVPFKVKGIVEVMVMTLLPVAPLLLTTFSVEELLERMLKLLF
jgi:hypothetical protein